MVVSLLRLCRDAAAALRERPNVEEAGRMIGRATAAVKARWRPAQAALQVTFTADSHMVRGVTDQGGLLRVLVGEFVHVVEAGA